MAAKSLDDLLRELDETKTEIEDNHIAMGRIPDASLYTTLSTIITDIETHIASLKNNNATKADAQAQVDAAKITLAAKKAGGRRSRTRRSKKTRRHSKTRAKKTRRN
jgi:hypothetical protein